MELPERYLRLLVSLASSRSMTVTAAELGLSQPAVSQQLARLERAWGVVLFERRPRGVQPTGLGEHAAAAAASALAELSALRALLDDARRRQVAVLRIDYLAYGAGDLMNEIIRRFRAENPECAVELSNSGFADGRGALLSGKADVQFIFGPIAAAEVTARLLYYDPVEIAVPESSVWADYDVIDIDDLLDEPILVDPCPDPQWRQFWSLGHARAGAPARIGGVYSTVEAHLNAVALGEGITVVSQTTAALYPREGVRYVPVTGLAPLPHWLAWRTDTTSPYVRSFVEVADRCLAAQAVGRAS